MKLATLPDLTAELKRLVVEVANLGHLAPDDIRDDEPLFRDGLGLDSIDLLEIAVHMEKRYGLKVQNDELGRRALANVGNLAQALHAHLSGAAGHAGARAEA
jgi:acyl carrier protein